MLAPWLKKLKALKARARSTGRPTAKSRGFQPRVELLEDRLAPATITVTSTMDSGPGSLRAALAAAANGDTINFNLPNPSTIQLTTSKLVVSKSVTIQGPGAAALTVNGIGTFIDFQVNANVAASISGLTISGGSGDGGGIYNSGTLSVMNCVISGNSSIGSTTTMSGGFGGGFFNSGTMLLMNSVVTGNTATGLGGGGYNDGVLDIESSVISSNLNTGTTSDGEGGGITNNGATLIVNNSLFMGNTATNGGGIENENEGGPGTPTATITNTTFTGNTCTGGGDQEGGGAILNDDAGVLIITNCTISGNSAGPLVGGGIYNRAVGGATTTATNCTIVQNTAASGGGIGIDDGSINLVNCLVAQNTAAGSPDLFENGGTITASNTIIGDGTGEVSIVNGTNGNQVGTATTPINPVVAALAYYGGPSAGLTSNPTPIPTQALLPGSPAIDAGAGGPATDQRGFGRVNATDIGAFESQGFVMTITAGNPQRGVVTLPYTVPLTVQLLANNPLEPVVGGLVTFTAPTTGPSVTFPNGKTTFLATINAIAGLGNNVGQASVVATANSIPGGFQVIASATGANSVTFNLFNVQPLVAVGADAGALPEVKVYNALTGGLMLDFLAFTPAFRGGVRVAVGDVNGDGFYDIVCGAGPGGGPMVTVFSGKDGSIISGFYAFTPSFTGGLYVAAGDVTGTGIASVIAGADAGGGPQVNIFDGVTGRQLDAFFAYPVFFTGGVRVAAGDVNGDGRAEIITAAGPGGSPEVKAFGFKNLVPVRDFFAFPVFFTGGVYVAAGPLIGAGITDIIVGAGQGGLPQVNVFNGQTSALLSSFYAISPLVPKVDAFDELAGVRVGFACGGCPHGQIVTGLGPGPFPQVEVFDGDTLITSNATPTPTPGGSFLAFDRTFLNGIFVGGA